MPNWKYPCLKCGNCCRQNQDSICCDHCNKWVHLKCTNLTSSEFDYYSSSNINFFCDLCVNTVNSDLGPDIHASSSSAQNSISFSPITNESSTDTESDLNFSVNSNDYTVNYK